MIRQAIREVVKRRKLTHLQVSILTGVDTGTISRFLSGRRGVTDKTADRLLAGLGLRVKAPNATHWMPLPEGPK